MTQKYIYFNAFQVELTFNMAALNGTLNSGLSHRDVTLWFADKHLESLFMTLWPSPSRQASQN